MKKLIFTLLVLFTTAVSFAQSTGADANRIAISVVLTEDVRFVPAEVRSLMNNKLMQLVTQNGLGGTKNNRFVLTAGINTLSKTVTATAPAQILQELQINFFIADVVEKKVFSSSVVTVKGVGQTEEKSLLDGIKQVSPKNKEVVGFIDSGKKKILDYYMANCDMIIQKAKTQASQRNYESALSALNEIPMDIPECFNKVQVAANQIYLDYQNHLCDKNLAQAKAVWSAGLDKAAADEASVYLAQITPDAKCYGSAQALVNEIKDRTKELWKFELKKYNDSVDLEKQRIKAWRDVGVAYGNNQPDVVYDVLWIF
ncbi:MAG: hypothetical protein ACK5C5_03360 [Bacteroidota bacterium]|jgi:hypothetical protein